MPRISHAPATSGRTGIACSSSRTREPASRARARSASSRARRASGRASSGAPGRARRARRRARAPARCRSRASTLELAGRRARPGRRSRGRRSCPRRGRGRPGCGSPEVDAHRRPTPAVVTKRPSALPRSTTFVSPATTATPARSAARAIERAIRRRSSSGKPSSITNPAREPERLGAGDGEVVDRPVDGELADVAAREEERLDDVRVGREREPPVRGDAPRRRARRAAGCELLEEEPLDEHARRLAAGAVRERDQLVTEPSPHATRSAAVA